VPTSNYSTTRARNYLIDRLNATTVNADRWGGSIPSMARRGELTAERRAPQRSLMLRRGIPRNPVAHATDEPSAHNANPTVSLHDTTSSTDQRPGGLSSAAATACLFPYADGDFSLTQVAAKRREGKGRVKGLGSLLKPGRGGIVCQQPDRFA
jgi:hypothetical protein